jgi:hypothetical protein
VQQLVSEVFISDIAGIALDPLREKLYFTCINPLIDSLFPGGVGRADLDGSNIEPLVGGQGKPIGIAVDAAGGGFYWADALSISPAGGSGAIKAANLDGQNERTILGGLDVPYGIALDLAARYVYWTDMGTGKIQRTTMSGTLPFFEDIVTGLPSPTAVVIVPEPDGGSQCIVAAAGGVALTWWNRRRQIQQQHRSFRECGYEYFELNSERGRFDRVLGDLLGASPRTTSRDWRNRGGRFPADRSSK